MTDPIADMLTRLRNAALTKQRDVVMPFSKLKLAILKILQGEGFVTVVEPDADHRTLRVSLRFASDGRAAFRGLKRVSTPGRRSYVKARRIPRVLGGLGIAIVSTPVGVMTDREARRRRLGGELICEVY